MSSSNTSKHFIFSPTSILNTTLSTSSSTGALTVTGGIGVKDTINIKNSIGALGYMYNSSSPIGSSLISTNVKTMNNRIRTSRANANNCVSSWTTRTTPADNAWRGVTWSPELGIFVAVAWSGAGNRAMSSPDGINWTIRTTPADNLWRTTAWSPELGIFIAVSDTVSTTSAMSSTNGITWTLRNTPAGFSWQSCCWSPELSIFVAVGATGTGARAMSSSDGINWISRTTPVNNQWTGVCWSAELALFVAVANTGSGNRVMTSTDGINWVLRSSAADNGWWSVCWSPELGIFVSLADSGTGNRIMTSLDGITWTSRTNPVDNNWNGVCWSPELSIFVGTAYGGDGNRIMTSSNGINWTVRSSAANNAWTTICWSPELSIFVTVADSGVGNRVMTSAIGLPNSKSALLANPSYVNVNNATGVVNVSSTLQLATNSNTVNATSGALTLQGDLHFYNSSRNTIVFPTNALAPPSYTNRSIGTRIVLYPLVSASACDYAIGMDGNTMWFSTDLPGNSHVFYCGTTMNTIIGNGRVNIPTGTASTSSSSGALVVTGGVGIGGAIYSAGIRNISNTTQLLNTSNAVSSTSGALTLQGDLHFYNGTRNTIVFNNTGVGPPTYTNRSPGTKIAFYPNVSVNTVDFAIGIENSSMWYSVENSSANHKFYCGTTLNVQIGGGRVNIPITQASTSTGSGCLVVSWGVGISENVNVAGSMNIGSVPALQRPLCVTKSVAQGAISIWNTGDARYHLYNGGAVAEWLFGQKSQSDHSFKISTLNGVSEVDRFTLTTSSRLGIGNTIGPVGALHLGRYDTNCNIVFEAGATSEGGNVGFSSINWNGYFSNGEQRINTGKNRWRLFCEQRGASDELGLDIAGTTNRSIFRIYASGYIGINNNTPTYPLHIRGFNNVMPLYVDSGSTTAGDLVFFEKNYVGNAVVRLDTPSGGGYLVWFGINSNNVGTITTNGTGTSYATSSDYRLKENIKDFTNALTTLSKLKVYQFQFKTAKRDNIQGFLAHEVQQIIQGVASGKKDEVEFKDGKLEPVYQMVDMSKMIPLLVRAVQELREKRRVQLQIINKKIKLLEELVKK